MEKLTDILYVEDDADIQEIVQLTLEHLGGMKVKVCNSCKNALLELEKYTPQLILLDVMMPETDGIETLEALRKIPNVQDIPVVFITAKVQKQELDSYLAHGALGIIKKPFDPDTLVESLNSLWSQYCQTKK